MEIKATDSLTTATDWIAKAVSDGREGSLHYRMEGRSSDRLILPRYVVMVLDERPAVTPVETPHPEHQDRLPAPRPFGAPEIMPRSVKSRGGSDTHTAYTDGGCWPNPGGPGGAGVVMLTGGKREERSIFLQAPTTNNRAELMAVREALLMIEDRRAARLSVGTDSLYVKGVLSDGHKPRANRALIAEVRVLASECASFRMFHVRGHSGVEGNEAADRLAGEGAEHQDRLPALNG
jgi:ribonuclease HI